MGDSETYITIEMIEITAQNLESFILAWPGLGSTLILARLDLNWQNCDLIKARLKSNKGKKARPVPGPGKKCPTRPCLPTILHQSLFVGGTLPCIKNLLRVANLQEKVFILSSSLGVLSQTGKSPGIFIVEL